MSDFVLHKGQRAAGELSRSYGSEVVGLAYQPNELTVVSLADGRSGRGTCVGCSSPPCAEKHPTEHALPGALDAYPGDPSLDVCPTKAIAWDSSREVMTISGSDCIGCGLCVVRCPYGAIALSSELTAIVDGRDVDGLVTTAKWRGEHPTPKRSGQVATLDSPVAAQLPTSVGALSDARSALLIRNLLNEVGINARVRRRGDTNMRVDGVGFSRTQRPLVVEIELGAGVLESPRALLEDIAILHARYGYSVGDIDPLSVILAFPNIRSEYYQVIRDIEKVLGVRCRTITIGALLALVWTLSDLGGFTGDLFAIGDGPTDLRGSLDISDDLLREPYPGAFGPGK